MELNLHKVIVLWAQATREKPYILCSSGQSGEKPYFNVMLPPYHNGEKPFHNGEKPYIIYRGKDTGICIFTQHNHGR